MMVGQRGPCTTRLRVASWYWIKFRNEKTWAHKRDDETWFNLPGDDQGAERHEIEILAGPLSEQDIDNAYWDYWV